MFSVNFKISITDDAWANVIMENPHNIEQDKRGIVTVRNESGSKMFLAKDIIEVVVNNQGEKSLKIKNFMDKLNAMGFNIKKGEE